MAYDQCFSLGKWHIRAIQVTCFGISKTTSSNVVLWEENNLSPIGQLLFSSTDFNAGCSAKYVAFKWSLTTAITLSSCTNVIDAESKKQFPFGIDLNKVC